VTQEEVFRVFGENTDRLRATLMHVIAELAPDESCSCRHSLDGLDVGVDLP
jgi:5'-methylthioadenosine phosphorylase